MEVPPTDNARVNEARKLNAASKVVMPWPAMGANELQRIVVAIKPWERGLPLAATHARQLAKSVGAELERLAQSMRE